MDIAGLWKSQEFRNIVLRLRRDPGRAAAFDIQSGAERARMEQEALNRVVKEIRSVKPDEGVEFARKVRELFVTPRSTEQEIRAIESFVPDLITVAERHHVPLDLAAAMLRAYVNAPDEVTNGWLGPGLDRNPS
jgi:IS4 transposase